MYQKESWEKEFEKVMGCIPECANGLYEDVGCPAHGYDAMKAIKFFRSVLSNREKEIAEKVRGLYQDTTIHAAGGTYFELEDSERNETIDEVLQILNHK